MPNNTSLAGHMPSEAHREVLGKIRELGGLGFNTGKTEHPVYLHENQPESLGYQAPMPLYPPFHPGKPGPFVIKPVGPMIQMPDMVPSSMPKPSDYLCHPYAPYVASQPSNSNGAVLDEGRPESASPAQVQVTETMVDSDADKTSKKRKAEDISSVTGEETSWLEEQSRQVEASAPASPAPSPELDVPATEPAATSEPMAIDSEPQAVSAESTSDTCSAETCVVTLSTSDERQPKRMRLLHIAERAGYVALGGVTAGAMIFGTLVYTAPSFV
jgi:hypothetical protein